MSHYRTGKRRSRRHACTHRVQFTPLSSLDKHMDNGARQAHLLNISKDGVGMRIRGESLDEGSLITLRIPTSVRTITVPVLTAVKWVREQKPGYYHVGLHYVME